MATIKKIDDEIRLNILEALLKKRSVVPNIRQLQKYTGYHKATIKSSLDFLGKEGVLTGFGPKVNFRKFDYKLEPMVLLQVDMTKKKLFDNLMAEINKDPNLYRLSSLVGSGNWNLIARHIYEDVESYHKGSQEKYYQKIPGIYELITDREIFYGTEPHYKNESRTESIIKIIRQKKGFG
jgi:DNA-binding Lrp family transcriptional regulator